MSLFSRFFGKSDDNQTAKGALIANPDIKQPLSLQVLFPKPLQLDSNQITQALRGYHSSMSKARCEIDPQLSSEGKILGLLGWQKHVIRCVGFDAPMPAEA